MSYYSFYKTCQGERSRTLPPFDYTQGDAQNFYF